MTTTTCIGQRTCLIVSPFPFPRDGREGAPAMGTALTCAPITVLSYAAQTVNLRTARDAGSRAPDDNERIQPNARPNPPRRRAKSNGGAKRYRSENPPGNRAAAIRAAVAVRSPASNVRAIDIG